MVSSSLNLHDFCSWTGTFVQQETKSNTNIELAGSIRKLATNVKFTDPKINHHHKNTIKLSKWLLEEELATKSDHIYRLE